MKKRIIIVHGWEGSPNSGWMPWAKVELEKSGYKVLIPEMPDMDYPKIATWVPYLSNIIGEVRATDTLIGHSMGCQTILRYLESLPVDKKVEKVILIAGFVSLMGLTKEEWVIAKPWLDTPLNLENVRGHANFFLAIFSDNDPFVPVEENSKIFKTKLGAKIIIEKNKGHFIQNTDMTNLPILLENMISNSSDDRSTGISLKI